MSALVVTAMDEEARPFLQLGSHTPVEVPLGAAWRVEVEGRSIVVLRSGIGLVNAAATTAAALTRLQPGVLVSAGSAGGLAEGILVGDIVIGTSFAYADADATGFGYAIGQVPGMPEFYTSDAALSSSALSARSAGQRLRPGRIVSGNSFVDARTVERVRASFPGALATDMESAALAQVAYLWGLPFLSVRGVSDLCGPHAGQDFHMSVEEVAGRAAHVVAHVVNRLG